MLVLYAKLGNAAEGLAHTALSSGINQSISSYNLKPQISQLCKCNWGLNSYKKPHAFCTRLQHAHQRAMNVHRTLTPLNTIALMLQPSNEYEYFSPLTSILSKTSHLSFFYKLDCLLQGFCTTAILKAAPTVFQHTSIADLKTYLQSTYWALGTHLATINRNTVSFQQTLTVCRTVGITKVEFPTWPLTPGDVFPLQEVGYAELSSTLLQTSCNRLASLKLQVLIHHSSNKLIQQNARCFLFLSFPRSNRKSTLE